MHSGGFVFELDGPAAVDHLDALCFGKTDRDVLAVFAAGLPEVPRWIRSLGGDRTPVELAAFGGMLPSWPHFPGGGNVHYRQFVPRSWDRPGVGLWRLLEGPSSIATSRSSWMPASSIYGSLAATASTG